MTTKFTAHQLRSFYNPFRIILKIALSISLLIQITLAVSDDQFRISSLSLDGENDINQCTNHLLQFRWSYSHSAENLLIDLVLIRQNADSDTAIWSSGIRSLDDTAFRYVSFSDIHDGGT